MAKDLVGLTKEIAALVSSDGPSAAERAKFEQKPGKLLLAQVERVAMDVANQRDPEILPLIELASKDEFPITVGGRKWTRGLLHKVMSAAISEDLKAQLQKIHDLEQQRARNKEEASLLVARRVVLSKSVDFYLVKLDEVLRVLDEPCSTATINKTN